MAEAPRGQIDVAHAVVGAGLPKIGSARAPRQRLQREGVTKRHAASVMQDVDRDVRLDEESRQFRGLVGRNASRAGQARSAKTVCIHHPNGEWRPPRREYYTATVTDAAQASPA
jgi:hypothetical protein